jgi:ABC-type nitrate/sulfonate/bicarbonate transport system substrate-binding protein
VTLLDMPPAAQLAALKNREIDAAMVWEPWLQRMVHEANARIIATEGDIGVYTNVTSYAARSDWLRENRETAVRFLQAVLMAYEVLQKDPGIGVRAVATEMGIRERTAKEIYRDAPPPNIYWWTDHGIDIHWPESPVFTGGLSIWRRSCSMKRSFRRKWT